ncbi:MAG: hypothetical protein HKO57_01240, partial [Akkermansiaceae bacterium]|nr:hypothetical protein [Akkermansiaceae bacterium]
VQHAKSYAWLTMRSKLVPVVGLSSKLMPWLLIGGIAFMSFSGNPMVLWVAVIAFAMTTLFAFITLPVEFDASKRAMAWMEGAGLASSMHQDRAKNALFWAAMTYVVAALASLAQLAYYLMILLGRRN